MRVWGRWLGARPLRSATTPSADRQHEQCQGCFVMPSPQMRPMRPYRFFHSCWLLWAAALVIHLSFSDGSHPRLPRVWHSPLLAFATLLPGANPPTFPPSACTASPV